MYIDSYNYKLHVCGYFAEANLGKAWLTDHITGIHTQYKAFTTKKVVADIGIGIGLRGINVTLLGICISIAS